MQHSNAPKIRNCPITRRTTCPSTPTFPCRTSYMCMGSQEDFFGGYDYKAQAGIVHIANHHISPGKKQWTWGNHEFGYAWDRNLTDADERGEYCALHRNHGRRLYRQPARLQFPPARRDQNVEPVLVSDPENRPGAARESGRGGGHAGLLPAMRRNGHRAAQVGVAVTSDPAAKPELLLAAEWQKNLSLSHATSRPASRLSRKSNCRTASLKLICASASLTEHRRELISYQPKPRVQGESPAARHRTARAGGDRQRRRTVHHRPASGTISPRHALPDGLLARSVARDPLDSRCNNAMGLWHLRRGEFAEAEKHFRRGHRPADAPQCQSLRRRGVLQSRPVPALSWVRDEREPTMPFYKATWNQAWMRRAITRWRKLIAARKNWATALEHLNRSLRFNTDNLRARNLKAMVLRKLGRAAEADTLLHETLALDPLDWWARHLPGEEVACDSQTRLTWPTISPGAGLYPEAIELAGKCSAAATARFAGPKAGRGAAGSLHARLAARKTRRQNGRVNHFKQAAAASPDYCFPARLEEIAVLESAMRANPRDARAPYYLGNLLYDRRRHEEAIRLWERSAKLDPEFFHRLAQSRHRLFQHFKKTGQSPRRLRQGVPSQSRRRAAAFRARPALETAGRKAGKTPARTGKISAAGRAARRFERGTLRALQPDRAATSKRMQLLSTRKFQPWEGGEGQALGQHVRTQLALGREALAQNDYPCAVRPF